MKGNNIAPCNIRRTAGAAITIGLIVMLNSSDEAVLHDGSLAKPYLATETVADGAEVNLLAIDDEAFRATSAGAHTEGEAVYLDISNGKVTATASALRLGFAAESKSSGAGDLLITAALQYAPVGTLAALAQTTSGTYSQAQVQAIADKVDALIALLKKAR